MNKVNNHVVFYMCAHKCTLGGERGVHVIVHLVVKELIVFESIAILTASVLFGHSERMSSFWLNEILRK